MSTVLKLRHHNQHFILTNFFRNKVFLFLSIPHMSYKENIHIKGFTLKAVEKCGMGGNG
jgi:hypothetical protein